MRTLILPTLLAASLASGQEQAKFFMPVIEPGQFLQGAPAAHEGAVGLAATRVEGGYRISGIGPISPAESAGLKTGDLITAIDDKPVSNLDLNAFQNLLRRKPGEFLKITYVRSSVRNSADIVVASRGDVYPGEAKAPPTISQNVLGGHFRIRAALSQTPSQQQSVLLLLWIANDDGPVTRIDDAKFFLLDGQGQQLQRQTLAQMKYPIQLWLAQNWRAGNYPPPNPPPAQHRYAITGTTNGTYSISNLGSAGMVSGTSTQNYTVQEQPDFTQNGYMLGYSLGTAIRQRADRKHNEQVHQIAQAKLAEWDAGYFKAESPLIPGETRSGTVVYWSGSSRPATAPFKVILFLPDPLTGADTSYTLTFQ